MRLILFIVDSIKEEDFDTYSFEHVSFLEDFTMENQQSVGRLSDYQSGFIQTVF